MVSRYSIFIITVSLIHFMHSCRQAVHFSLFFCFPLLSSYPFAIPYSNVIVLPFPSPPIQSAQTSFKVGLFIGRIEQPGQTISCGIVSLVLQIKEFPYSYLPIPDCMIGSIFMLVLFR